MFRIHIQGLKNGVYEIAQSCVVAVISLMAEEYFGDVTLTGKLEVLNKRYYFIGEAICNARLICDISLKEFIQAIKININIIFYADDALLKVQYYDPKKDLSETIIGEDDKYIDLTEEIRQQLIVNLPMKRIAPEYIGKTFEEIYPQYSGDNVKKKKTKEPIDERWAPLAKLKYKNN